MADIRYFDPSKPQKPESLLEAVQDGKLWILREDYDAMGGEKFHFGIEGQMICSDQCKIGVAPPASAVVLHPVKPL